MRMRGLRSSSLAPLPLRPDADYWEMEITRRAVQQVSKGFWTRVGERLEMEEEWEKGTCLEAGRCPDRSIC